MNSVTMCLQLSTSLFLLSLFGSGFSIYMRRSDYFPPNCGLAPVIRGREMIVDIQVQKGEQPWLAHINAKQIGYSVHNCSGSLINRRYVITSATCIALIRYYEADCVDITLGTADPDFITHSTIVVQAQKLIMHKKYDAISAANDIGIIRLAESIKFSSTVAPVCLPLPRFADTISTIPNSVVMSVGFGTGGLPHRGAGMSAGLYITGTAECNHALKKTKRKWILNSVKEICTMNKKRIVCFDYGGGPLLAIEEVGRVRRFVQVGVSASEYTNCYGLEPTIYCKVEPHMMWIREKMRPFS